MHHLGHVARRLARIPRWFVFVEMEPRSPPSRHKGARRHAGLQRSRAGSRRAPPQPPLELSPLSPFALLRRYDVSTCSGDNCTSVGYSFYSSKDCTNGDILAPSGTNYAFTFTSGATTSRLRSTCV